jgi:DNA-binding transcriptional ArsR family regulator
MKERVPSDDVELTGDEMLRMLSALANPHRLRIIAVLAAGRQYVSQLAREIGMSRPLLHMHLQRLEAAGLVTGTLELSDDGKAMRYFEVTPFALLLTPERIAEAERTLSSKPADSEAAASDEASGAETD